ncbi:unnamed protein product [Enterobius vermicularis]|uniref:t-SNARE coiled-coil homology domain-containing protein n=1 Tax=Enterobius vermicularis TaxID=51028 RepID=A0A0N4V182_ENTVE|nr:unnamed protein product [Enterobius vermicularis]
MAKYTDFVSGEASESDDESRRLNSTARDLQDAESQHGRLNSLRQIGGGLMFVTKGSQVFAFLSLSILLHSTPVGMNLAVP